ncbi:MAG: hypothetical protein LBG88_04145 [Christensenellaceae bacterium]|jgi:cell division ATPase FtsA|nr:hypothetical protein [Christensenellaceae bacterium]
MSNYVLYFGGENIFLTDVKANINNTYTTKSFVQSEYNGIINGEFADPGEIPGIIAKLVSEIKAPKQGAISIGVPSCFCSVVLKHEVQTYAKPQKITAKVIDGMLNGGMVAYYKLDGGAPMLDVSGQSATKIEAQVSHLTIDPKFLSAIGDCLTIKNYKIKYIPVMTAEAKYLIDTYVRDRTCVLISCKLTDTSVAVIVGDQTVALETFDMGTAHIINEISLVKKVNYTTARKMFERFDKADRDKIGGIIGTRLDDMAEQIQSIVYLFDKDLIKRPIYTCGGYTDALGGAITAMNAKLGCAIIPCACPFKETNPPDVVSRDAVIIESLK